MYEDRLYEVLKEEMLQEITQTDKREGSFVNDIISTSAMKGEEVWAELSKAVGVFFKKDCTGEYCDRFAEEYGITRKNGKKAKGTVTFTGEAGVEIPVGTLCATSAGLMFVTTEVGSIGASGTVSVPVEAEDIGDKYNILTGYINTLPVAIRDVTGVTNGAAFIGGAEAETDEELIDRLLLRLRTPATSGNAYHYLQWALEVEGVGNAKVFPLDNGPGTVGVMLITSAGRSPGEDVINAAAAHIEGERPIGATVSVYAPQEVVINIEAAIQISASTTLEAVKKEYQSLLSNYIKNSVFVLSNMDYYKCLSMFYDIPGVVAVKSFLLNGAQKNIPISEKQIQVLGSITIGGVVAG